MKFIIFADDTNRFMSDSNANHLVKDVNQELRKLVTWFRANKLSLNIEKKISYYSLQVAKKNV